MSTKSDKDDTTEKILSAADPEDNSFECFRLPLQRHEPSTIRRAFLRLSLKIHPDKNSHPRANEAFQKLSAAFEILYDVESQQRHLSQVLQPKSTSTSTSTTKHKTQKRPRPQQHWREARKRKKQQSNPPQWAQRNWDDVLKEMRRREELEKAFVRSKSDQQRQRRVQGMIWRAMKICRTLDEQAGCPPTFVNGLWAPLYEQEIHQLHPTLPPNWEYYNSTTSATTSPPPEPVKRIYRNVQTRHEQTQHPNPEVEQLLEKARKALDTNQYCFYTEPRKFLGEIIDYLREDHDYHDMDDDLLELEQEEKAREKEEEVGQDRKEYDY